MGFHRKYQHLLALQPERDPATSVNNFKATDMPTVSNVIHTDNQLHAGQVGKTAYTGWIQIINMKLVQLASAIDWEALDAEVAPQKVCSPHPRKIISLVRARSKERAVIFDAES